MIPNASIRSRSHQHRLSSGGFPAGGRSAESITDGANVASRRLAAIPNNPNEAAARSGPRRVSRLRLSLRTRADHRPPRRPVPVSRLQPLGRPARGPPPDARRPRPRLRHGSSPAPPLKPSRRRSSPSPTATRASASRRSACRRRSPPAPSRSRPTISSPSTRCERHGADAVAAGATKVAPRLNPRRRASLPAR
jgi:hypothetical protein